jgi:tetratricopeptide (TPR) repeat protein
MGANGPKRRTASNGRACGGCGAVLAWDNTGNLCSSCVREQRDQLRTSPAHLPDEFWDTDDFKAAFRAQDIGKVLKVYRNHPRHRQLYGRAISQSTLGRWLNLEQSKISRLEGGGPEQNANIVREYATKLNIPQRLLWILPEGESFFTIQNRVQAEYGPGIASSGLSALLGWDMRDEAKRRTFLTQAAGMVGAVLTLTDDPLGISGQRSTSSKSLSFDLETLEGLEQTTLGLRRAYRSAGALSLLGASHGTLNLLTEMMPYAGRHQNRLVTAIGQTAGLIGVMLTLDLNDFDAGGYYLSIATRAAKQANNDELLAFILGAYAFHAAYDTKSDSGGGRDYADAALVVANRGISPTTHSWLSAVASEMYATEKDELACRQLLDSAAAHLEAADPNEPWAGIGVFNADKLSAYVGGDLMRLGRYPEAQQHLHTALDRLDESLLKHRCTAYVDLAEAYAANNQVDEATEYAKNALTIVGGTRHAMSLQRIEKLYRRVRAANQGAGEQLGEMLIELRATW